MKRTFFALCLGIPAGIPAAEMQAQVWGPQTSGVVYDISHNGRYVTGLTLSVNGSGFVWDTEAGGFEPLGLGVYPYGVTGEGMLVGNFNDTIDGLAVLSGGYRAPGADRWSGLGAGLLTHPDAYDGSSARQITPDGGTIVGYSKKPGEDYVPTVPCGWRKNDAGQWTGTEWAHPDNIKQGYIIDIAADGQTGVGFIHPGTNRVAALWRSPDSCELPFSTGLYSEYLCISANGKYAGLSRDAGANGAAAGIHDLESNEIIAIPEGFRVNAVSNDGFACGIYRQGSIDRAFIRSGKLGFMDFGDFISTFVPEAELAPLKSKSKLWRALTDKGVTYSINAVTPDGWTFALCLQSGSSGEAYVVKITPVAVYPFPKNLAAEVPVADRNKAILSWEAPAPDGESPTGYAVYRNAILLETVDSETLTHTDILPTPGYYDYRVAALYGDKRSNFSNTAQAVIVNNYDLPLREHFDKQNLTANYWTAETDRSAGTTAWSVASDAGVENGTGLMLTVNNMATYDNKAFAASLTSKPLDGRNAAGIFLSFLVKPDYHLETTLTPDTLLVDVHDGSAWKPIDKYVFKLSMEWKADILDLSETAAGKFFRVRFRIVGANHTVSAKYIYFDDIVVATSPPAGNAIPEHILSEKTGDSDSVRLAWQNPQTGLYTLTYARSPKRFAIGNEGKSFIAANGFDAAGLSLYKGKYLTSVTAYVNRKKASPAVATELKLAVFINGQRVVDKAVSGVTPNAWNTFVLDNPIAIDGQELKFGIEVTAHDPEEEPVGVDGTRRPVSGKGDLYSEDGGQTWQTLSESGKVNNWSIAGNVSDGETAGARPATDIVGYNVYAGGVKLNDDLVFGQSFVSGILSDSYTIRAYSLATGLSAESAGAAAGMVLFREKQREPEICPNPVRDVLFVRSETPVESLTVYDLSGRVCKQAGPKVTALSAEDLNSGVYLVGIKTATGASVRKIYVVR